MTDFKLKDSGKREEFQTGARRDTREGKGRFDLISPFMLRRLALVMERGAVKYDPRNWEKGMPFSRFTDSALRHISQFIMGIGDEDHLAQAIFNLMALIHFQETGRVDLDDMPHYLAAPEGKMSQAMDEIIKASAGFDKTFIEYLRRLGRKHDKAKA